MLLGYFSGKIGRGFSKENKTTLIVMIGTATVLFEISSYILGMILYNYEISIFALSLIILKETLYNILIGRVLFKSLTVFAEIINKSKDSYYLL